MTQHLYAIVLIFSLLFSMIGCVSIDLPKSEVNKDGKIKFTPPPQPFHKSKQEGTDHTWIHPKKGSSISVLTNCDPNDDPSLEQILHDVKYSFSNPKVVSKSYVPYKKRKALLSTITGFIDGAESKIDLWISKNRTCIYILTYVSTPNFYEESKTHFSNFYKSFEE